MKRGKIFLQEIRKNGVLYLMAIPAVLYFVIFAYGPMAGVYLAFTKYNFKQGIFGSPFTGFENFRFLFSGGKDAIIWRLTKNTVLYNLAFLFLGNILQIIFAIIVSEYQGRRMKRFSQSAMFLPYFISYVIVGVLIYNVFNYEYGMANGILKFFGMEPVNFYSRPEIWKYVIIAVNLWKGIGYGMVVYLAAIMGLDQGIYEAASIDGANVFKRIWYLTIPLLKPTFIMLILFSLGGILKGQFDLFYQIIGNNGQLYAATDIIDTYVYRSLTVNFDVGLGTAAGLYQSFFGMILVLTVNFIVRKLDEESALF